MKLALWKDQYIGIHNSDRGVSSRLVQERRDEIQVAAGLGYSEFLLIRRPVVMEYRNPTGQDQINRMILLACPDDNILRLKRLALLLW